MTKKPQEENDNDTIKFKISIIKAYIDALEAKGRSE